MNNENTVTLKITPRKMYSKNPDQLNALHHQLNRIIQQMSKAIVSNQPKSA